MTIDSVYLDITALPADLLVLTPNRRLAAWLDRDYDSWQLSCGTRSWARLNAVPLEQWLQQWYAEICLLVPAPEHGHPRLLSSAQSALLWRQVLEQHWENGQDIDGLVALAQQARALLCRWRWQPAQWQAGDKLEQIEFARWHQAYSQLLRSQRCLDQPALAQWVMEQGSVLRAGLPRNIYLHGFNDPDEPQLRQFMQWLEQDGIRVHASAIPPKQSRCEIVTLPQVDDQFAQAIHWALQQRTNAARIGVVIPNLQAQRNRVRTLCRHLWSLQPDAADQHWSTIINITAAQTLGDYPLVSQLLLWLRGLAGELSLQEWNLLLTSPYSCAGESEWLRRDGFFQWLRAQNLKALRLSAVRERWLQRCGDDETSTWLGQLQSLQSRGRQPIVRWIQWFNRFMALVMSRQGRSLDSEEFQLQQRLLETLGQLQELHDWLGDIDFDRFRRTLEEALKNVQFQPQTETAPIQIMGVLEAAGLAFDRLWVCEMEAVNWPQSVNPNPLLSRPLQRAMNMPGASPERELQYATRLLAGFQTAADHVMFSWGEMQGETEHTCSALLNTLVASPFQIADVASAEQIQFEQLHDSIEVLPADVLGTPVADQHAKGGSGIIKSQSLCPFKAFAEYRLNLRAEDELADGIKASDRGSLLHKVMEMIWRELQDSAALAALLQDEPKLDTWLNNIIEREMQGFRQQVFLEPQALYDLERLRTFNIVRRWLQECDGQREPFNIVQVEKRRALQIGGLQLDLAVDRIDQLQSGDYVIVDYKSGDKDHKAWIGERPEEPQLPLYTLLEPDKTKGVLFGVLKPDALTYKGLLQQRDLFALGKNSALKQADDWHQQMQDWQKTLERLAEEYRQGRAEVSPLNDNTCTFCHLAAVCRVNEVAHDRD
jgi:probable DNA repair protein